MSHEAATRAPGSSPRVAVVRDVLSALAAWGSARDWVGPDPYDALNAPAAGLVGHSKRARQAVIQLNRRSPFRPPWPLRPPNRPNAKVAGLVLSGYTLPGGAQLDDAPRWADRMVERLEELRLP